MFKRLILSVCFALVPLCVFTQPVAETNPGENTASPKVSTEQREAPKEETKSLQNLAITEPQFPGVITTEEKEKK